MNSTELITLIFLERCRLEGHLEFVSNAEVNDNCISRVPRQHGVNVIA